MGPNHLFERAAIKLWRDMVPRFSMSAGGTRVSVSGNNLKASAFLCWEYGWKAELIRRVLEMESGDFLDIGANVGQTLIDYFAAGAHERYVGFEPNPHAFASIFTLIEENAFENCMILPVGLSDSNEILNLYSVIGAKTDSGASLVPDLRPTRKLKHTPIPCYRFDDMRSDLGIESISLIKIDVEGAELAVLRGMEATLTTLRPPIVCEVLFADAHADLGKYESGVRAIAAKLAEIDYAILWVRKDRLEKRFLGVAPLAEFPIQVWTSENAHECDYLLVPAEKLEAYRATLGRGIDN